MHPGDGRVISNFIVQALSGQMITIYGDGNQSRAFCYVDDLVDALLLLMEADTDVTGPINLGNPKESTIMDLAEGVASTVGHATEIVYCAAPEDDPRRRCPDIALARQVLNWTPKIDLEEGLRRTVNYFRELLSDGGGAAL
jgi:UDP-glucuronate decarboxylase